MNTEIEIKLPNYRLYDRTGGGVTHDIYAATLEDAIEAGREWIEDGDWERDEMETPLDCCVREIVRVPDLRSITSLPAIVDASVNTDGNIVVECGPNTILSTLPGRVIDGSVMDADGYYDVVLGDVGLPMMIDEDATLAGQSWDCSGTLAAKDAPECADGEEHDWQSPYEVVGGCRENPGVWGSGHGTIKQQECCAHCGLLRTIDYGATLPSNGQQATRISYEEDDERAITWAKSNQEESND
jgi:hypothetical protein